MQEALVQQQRLDSEQTTQRQGLLQTFKKLRARFNNYLAGNKPELLPDCAETPKDLPKQRPCGPM